MCIRPEPSITTTPMDDGGLVLLSERSGKLYRCNATAAAMWTALRQHDGQPDAAATRSPSNTASIRPASVQTSTCWSTGCSRLDL